jgi:hypothetical protein
VPVTEHDPALAVDVQLADLTVSDVLQLRQGIPRSPSPYVCVTGCPLMTTIVAGRFLFCRYLNPSVAGTTVTE